MTELQKYLLTTKKDFYYVSFSEKPKRAKRNKILAKYFQEKPDDTIYVCEDLNNIYFSDCSTKFAETYLNLD